MICVLMVFLLFLTTTSELLADGRLMEIELWPDGTPEPRVPHDPPEKTETGPDGLTRRFNVSRPRLFVHIPSDDIPRNGTAVIVVPGGGFGRMADQHEGSDACQWLISQGIVAFQLAYRTPTSKHTEPNLGPVQDTQKALLEVRKRAAEFRIDPSRIGLLGFSAGGQVALVSVAGESRLETLTRDDPQFPGSDFLLLIYPYRIYDPEQASIRCDVNLDSGLPPTFIAQMSDDTASLPHGSARLYSELVQRKVPTELHIYERGGHGFGMQVREGAPGTADWKLRAMDWLAIRGLLEPIK